MHHAPADEDERPPLGGFTSCFDFTLNTILSEQLPRQKIMGFWIRTPEKFYKISKSYGHNL
jgi:hypothetical protein